MGAFTENPDHLTDPDLQKRLQGEPLWDISAAFAITNDKQTGHLKEHWFGEGGGRPVVVASAPAHRASYSLGSHQSAREGPRDESATVHPIPLDL